MTITGDRLRSLRKEKNKTLREVEQDTSIAYSGLASIERGERSCNSSTLEILANYFGVSTDYLLGNTGSNNLKKLRLQKRLTLDELSLKVNIPKSVLSCLENEVKPFTEEQKDTLSKFFNVSTDYLLGNTDNQKLQTFTVVDSDGTITRIQRELIDATKGLTVEDMDEIFNYVDYLKSKKGNKQNEK